MINHLFLFKENSNLNLDIIYDDLCVVIKGNKNDLQKEPIPLLAQPGIYLLLSENLIYVGQSGHNVSKRLSLHLSEKDWWEDFIVITDKHGELEKTLTEYIEAYLISYITHEGLTLDNDTKGNLSKVSLFNKMKASSIIENSLYIIQNILKFNLTKEQKKSNIEEKQTHNKLKLEDSNEQIFEASSYIKLLHSFLTHYATFNFGEKYSTLLMDVTEDPGPKNIIALSPNNEDDFIKITGDLYMYTKLTKAQVLYNIEYFAEVLDLKIELSEL